VIKIRSLYFKLTDDQDLYSGSAYIEKVYLKIDNY